MTDSVTNDGSGYGLTSGTSFLDPRLLQNQLTVPDWLKYAQAQDMYKIIQQSQQYPIIVPESGEICPVTVEK